MKFQVPGPLQVEIGGRAKAVSAAKLRKLLGVLLLHANQVVSADRLPGSTELGQWIQQGLAPITPELAAHLQPRLLTGTAGTWQKQQGEAAKVEFKQALEDRLTRPSGTKRQLYLHAADEHFDHYGRLLAYIAPSSSKAELAQMTRHERRTFNMQMVEIGWAASLLIYPSLLRYVDLEMFYAAAKDAVDNNLGAWADPMLLTGYEWRMCIKLHKVTQKLVAGDLRCCCWHIQLSPLPSAVGLGFGAGRVLVPIAWLVDGGEQWAERFSKAQRGVKRLAISTSVLSAAAVVAWL